MGNVTDRIARVFQDPVTIDILRAACVHCEDATAVNIINVLLKGALPTNFNYSDICDILQTYAGDRFIVIPWWTVSMKSVDSCCISMVNAWPAWTENEVHMHIEFIDYVYIFS